MVDLLQRNNNHQGEGEGEKKRNHGQYINLVVSFYYFCETQRRQNSKARPTKPRYSRINDY